MADIKLIDAQGDERTYSGVAKVKIPLADGTGNATFIQPAGKKELTGTNEVDVTNFATAQVVDENLIAENIKSGVSILGVEGTHEGGGELYEVMDASELPEDAPNGSLALVEGEPIPEAYTVSSVNELPSDAVDGSMAIVGTDSIVGTWKFPAILEKAIDHCYTTEEYQEFPYYRPLNASWEDLNNGVTVYISSFYCVEFHNVLTDPDINYYSNGIELGEENDCWTYDIVNRWANPYARKINILEAPEAEVENWVREVAKKVYSLYIRENGQWVYKCEVV